MSFKLSSTFYDDDFGDTAVVKDVFLNEIYGFVNDDELCYFCFRLFSEVVYGNDDVYLDPATFGNGSSTSIPYW